MKQSRVISTILLGICGSMLLGVDLVRQGKPQASIVISEKPTPSERYAAEELSQFIKRISGAELAVGSRPVAGLVPVRIGLADGAFMKGIPAVKRLEPQVKDDGFAVAAGPDGICLTSRAGRGLLYAVYHVLREYGGVYFLYPGAEGEVVPKATGFAMADGEYVRNPAFVRRNFLLNSGPGWTPDTFIWMVRNGLVVYHLGYPQLRHNKDLFPLARKLDFVWLAGGGMERWLVGPTQNNQEFNAKSDALMKEHPEFYGISKGRRLPSARYGDCCQPCTSNPATLKRMLHFMIEEIKEHQGQEVMFNFANDDHTTWCECENCRKLDSPLETDGGLNTRSSRWWHFVNAMVEGIVAAGVSDKVHFESFAYQNYRLPPKAVKADTRVQVQICPHQRCYIHALNDPNCQINAKKFRPLFESWRDAGIHAFTFEYHPEMPGRTNYLFHEKVWVEDLRYYHSLKMAGFGMVVNVPNPQTNYSHYAGTPNHYNCLNRWMSSWQQHFLSGYYSWNIDADFDTISEKINSLYYGAAWPAMRNYRAMLNKAILDSQVHMGYGTPNTVLGKCYDRPGLPRKAEAYLHEAEKLAKGDTLRLKRIAKDREYFKMNWLDAYEQYKATLQKEYSVRRRSGKVIVDGVLDEGDWKESAFVSDFKDFNDNAKKGTPETFVRMLFDRDNVYFAIECMKAASGKVEASAKGDGLAALEGSHLEIFLTPPELKGQYYHLGFSVNGHLWQALTMTSSGRDESVRLNPDYKIRHLEDRWILETRIPLEPLKVRVHEGTVWRVNVGRAGVADSGKLHYSSWSAGVFHGSDVHRSVAFGNRGAILRNGDMEDLITAKKRDFKDSRAKEWEFLSPTVPNFWYFNEANGGGKMEMRTDGAASGEYYMRIWGRLTFLGGELVLPEKRPAKVRITAQVRGKGELILRLYNQGKYHGGEQKVSQVNSKDNWVTMTNEVAVPKKEFVMLLMRVNGEIDLDDVRVTPLEDAASAEAAMPTAEKHR